MAFFQTLIVSLFLFSGCGYHMGYSRRQITGGYKEVAIPIFKNLSQEVGIEVYFTNSLKEEFVRTKIAKVVSVSEAPMVVEGRIVSVKYKGEGKRQGPLSDGSANSPLPNLPVGAVLSTQYRVNLVVDIQIRRSSDQQILWASQFAKEGVYLAPQLESSRINSANALYNHSARHKIISELASNMMVEAYDRITESF